MTWSINFKVENDFFLKKEEETIGLPHGTGMTWSIKLREKTN